MLDIAAAVLAMEHGLIPPTPDVFDVCHDLDLVTGTARPAELRTALVLSRGLMGSNAALVLRRGPGHGRLVRQGERYDHRCPTQVTVDELATLMKKGAGVTVDPRDLESRVDTPFDEFGLDSLGLLGIVGELENRHGRALPTDAERCKSPRDFLDLVNSTLMTGA